LLEYALSICSRPENETMSWSPVVLF
jgi:hypothetical protein